MPAVILDADTLASGALDRDSPARQLLIVLGYGSVCRYLDVTYQEDLEAMSRQAGVLELGRADKMIGALSAQRQELENRLPSDAPTDYWLVTSEALQSEARDLIYERIYRDTGLWAGVDLPAWRRTLAAALDVVTAEDADTASKAVALTLWTLGFPRSVMELALRFSDAFVVLRDRPRRTSVRDALLKPAKLEPASIQSLQQFLATPPWAHTGFDLRAVDPTL